MKKFKNIGHKIIHLPVVDSTNNYLTMLYNKGDINHGCVIMADKQTSGRGQRDNMWQSEDKKNLMFSICIEPLNFPISRQFNISCMISISIIHFLNKIGLKAKIKWPNDIMVGEKKIAGILIENQLIGKEIKFSNIGIGININQLYFSDLSATSLSIELNNKRDLKSDFNLLINLINLNFSKLLHKQKILRDEYFKHLYQYQEISNYKSKNKLFSGMIVGVSDWGKLQVKVGEKILEFDNKEIQFV